MTPWRQKTLNSSFNLCYERDTFIMSIVGNKRDGYLCVCVYVSERVYVCVCVYVCVYVVRSTFCGSIGGEARKEHKSYGASAHSNAARAL